MKNLFLFSILLLLIFSSCEKEIVTTEDTIETQQIGQEKAGGICILGNSIAPAHFFEFCTGEYIFQGELHLVNQNNGFHDIQAIGKCHKLGDPDNLIDIAEIAIQVSGNMHIGCEVPIDVQVPSDYNTNLVFGEVPFKKSCFDCGFLNLTISYNKDITYLFLDDVLKAHLYFKIKDCGKEYKHYMDVTF